MVNHWIAWIRGIVSNRIYLPVCLVFLLGNVLQAQESDVKDVHFNTNLRNVINMSIVANNEAMSFSFQNSDDYNDGVTKDINEVTEIIVEASVDWDLMMKAESETFVAQGSASGAIPLNNLGYYVVSTGSHNASNCLNLNATNNATTKAVDHQLMTVISPKTGSHNIGNGDHNRFKFVWQMGTMNGNMNQKSMFHQMMEGVFTTGNHLLTVSLTIKQVN